MKKIYLWILILCLLALLLLLAYELTIGKKKEEIKKESTLIKRIEELNRKMPIEYEPIAETREKNFKTESAYRSYTKAKAKKEFGSYGKEAEKRLAESLQKYLEYEKQFTALKTKYLGCEETLSKVKVSKKSLIRIEEAALEDLKQAKPETEYSIYIEVNLNVGKENKSKSYTLTHEDY